MSDPTRARPGPLRKARRLGLRQDRHQTSAQQNPNARRQTCRQQRVLFYPVCRSPAHVLGVDPVTARSHGILIVEIGVGMAVMAVMVTLYYNLASAGRQDEGL